MARRRSSTSGRRPWATSRLTKAETPKPTWGSDTSGPKPVITPRATSRSRRACAVARATPASRATVTMPARGWAASTASRRLSRSSMAICTAYLPPAAQTAKSRPGMLTPAAGRCCVGTMTDTAVRTEHPTVADQILGWDHLEWWVGNARAVTAWLTSGFGFHVAAYAGPETGVADRVSYLLEQGEIRFVVTAGLGPESEVAAHVLAHGAGVRNVAWKVADPAAALESATGRGAEAVVEPTTTGPTGREAGDGTVTVAGIATY